MPYLQLQVYFSFFNKGRHRLNQPNMKHIPPIGVTGPKNFSQSAPHKVRVHKKYKEPENKIMPQKKSALAQS